VERLIGKIGRVDFFLAFFFSKTAATPISALGLPWVNKGGCSLKSERHRVECLHSTLCLCDLAACSANRLVDRSRNGGLGDRLSNERAKTNQAHSSFPPSPVESRSRQSEIKIRSGCRLRWRFFQQVFTRETVWYRGGSV
jgi:hypothetical protein